MDETKRGAWRKGNVEYACLDARMGLVGSTGFACDVVACIGSAASLVLSAKNSVECLKRLLKDLR